MYFTVELVLKSYMPRHLEPGMWFITKLNPGTRKEYTEIWALDKTPLEPLEEFITKHGAPVEPYIIYDEQVLAEPHQIGWWDDGPQYDELRDIELKDINLILEEYDGYIDIMIDDWDFAHEDEANPILNADPITKIEKVALCIPGLYDDEDDDDWEDDDSICAFCNGSGEGSYDGSVCSSCGGSGVDKQSDDGDPDGDWDDMDDDSWKEH